MFQKDYMRVKDIYSVPAKVYIGGKKAIKVNGIWAYVQLLDGMRIYRYSEMSEVWELVQEIIATNF